MWLAIIFPMLLYPLSLWERAGWVGCKERSELHRCYLSAKRCNALRFLHPTYTRQDLIDCDSNLKPSIWIGITNIVCWRAGMPIFAAFIPIMALPTLSAAIGSGSAKGWGKRNGITCMSGWVNNWWASWNFAAFPMNPRPAMCS